MLQRYNPTWGSHMVFAAPRAHSTWQEENPLGPKGRDFLWMKLLALSLIRHLLQGGGLCEISDVTSLSGPNVLQVSNNGTTIV